MAGDNRPVAEHHRIGRRAFLAAPIVYTLLRPTIVASGVAAQPSNRPAVVDDTPRLQLLLANARTAGQVDVDLKGKHFVITSRLVIDSIGIRNFSANFIGQSASIRLTGNAPSVRNFRIDHGNSGPAFGKVEGGVFNLHLSRDAVIGQGVITGTSRRAAIFCMSRADRTTIEQLQSHAAWGIVFNDMAGRTIDGVDYADVSIGSALVIRDCRIHGHAGDEWSGDGIEINTPRQGFRNILITDCQVTRTISSPSVGMAFGLCNVRNARITRCTATNCTSPAGALHAEWSDDVVFDNCSVIDSEVGASVSMSGTVTIRNCRFENCRVNAVQSFNQFPKASARKDAGKATRLLVIDGCVFNNPQTATARNATDLTVARLDELRFTNNIVNLSATSLRQRILIMSFQDKSVDRLVFDNNRFVGKPSMFVKTIASAGGTQSLRMNNNEFDSDDTRSEFNSEFRKPSSQRSTK